MKGYSVRKNLDLMAMAFSRPRLLLDSFLEQPSSFYSIVPLIIFTVFYEILYILDYFLEGPNFHVIAGILQIPDAQYNLYQIFLFPAVHIVDFLVFFGAVKAFSRLFRVQADTAQTVYFFVFIWNTIGLLAAAGDTVTIVWSSPFFAYLHPLCGVIDIVYLTEFVHKDAEIPRWKSLILGTGAFTAFVGFRMLFLG